MTTQVEIQKPRILEVLSETYWGGIRKMLCVEATVDVDNGNSWSEVEAYVRVEDNQGPDFTVSIPQPGFEDKGPKWHFEHAMLFGPLISARGNIYSAPEGI